MPLEIKKETLCSSRLFCQSKCEKAVSLEINLPDYCCDIKRILKCIVTSGVSGTEVSGENVTVSGSTVVRLIYVGEGDKIDCYEHTSPFSCSTQINKLPENSVIRTFTRTDYVNCRAASQRRVSISGSTSVLLFVYCEERNEIPVNIDGLCVESKKEHIKCTELLCQSEKIFDMSETVALEGDKSDIGKIVRSDCYVKIDSSKAVADKLLIKGNLCCTIVYTDAEKGGLSKVVHTMPVSQIVNLTGLVPDSDISVVCNVCQFALSSKNDSAGRCRLFEIAARVSAFVRCSKDKEITYIEDCYSTAYETAEDYRITDISTVLCNSEQEIKIDETFDLSEYELGDIIDMWTSDLRCNITDKDGCECTFLLSGIYKDKSGAVRYAQKNMNAEVKISADKKGENIRYDCNAKLIYLEYAMAGGTKVRVKATLLVDCYISYAEKKRLLYELKVDEKKKKEERYPALCLYFGEEGESLWSVARNYNTTKELIMKENSLDDDCLKNPRMIMIPCV